MICRIVPWIFHIWSYYLAPFLLDGVLRLQAVCVVKFRRVCRHWQNEDIQEDKKQSRVPKFIKKEAIDSLVLLEAKRTNLGKEYSKFKERVGNIRSSLITSLLGYGGVFGFPMARTIFHCFPMFFASVFTASYMLAICVPIIAAYMKILQCSRTAQYFERQKDIFEEEVKELKNKVMLTEKEDAIPCTYPIRLRLTNLDKGLPSTRSLLKYNGGAVVFIPILAALVGAFLLYFMHFMHCHGICGR